ncbi:uncharacterized protein PFL1_00460 [Pseudozyma flocculosa PF-1]|uniref:Uncharacterized protein n=1 Tax=Pseudozyma flocculosa TaxID=84751 RepID=A0A5C3EST5_9BASI|nr:uncharacterized protein PFL1_00460 [Pseudozyma flocculosa PF-1]EPQ32263.1 hypothetical protein PFL1_00460 [Pseudozyma flocculosa PF-1]SPO34785.1 uncharacterized protein PSFLO_00256 [Pseudozyma flocculosa]
MPPARKKGKGPIKRHHAFHGVIMVLGWLLPPLAVLVRFGVGFDFFINIFLTICGYIPGHGHNFWIQNIRNNKNAKHSPAWAIRYGLVKDYRVKKTGSGWSDRYGQGATDFQNADIVVDPVTGETRRDDRLDEHSRRGNIGGGHRFPAPWANNLDGSPRAEREDPYEEDNRGGQRGGGRPVRDPVTGAIIDDGSGGDRHGNGNYSANSLSRSSSRRSLGSRYAERYGLGAGDNSSRDSNSFNQDAQQHHGSSGGSRWGGLSGSSKKKSGKKDRWAREADVMGDPQRGSYRSDSFGSYDDDRSSDLAAPRGGSGGAKNGRTIRDPMEDRHDF